MQKLTNLHLYNTKWEIIPQSLGTSGLHSNESLFLLVLCKVVPLISYNLCIHQQTKRMAIIWYPYYNSLPLQGIIGTCTGQFVAESICQMPLPSCGKFYQEMTGDRPLLWCTVGLISFTWYFLSISETMFFARGWNCKNCCERPLTRDWPAIGDCLVAAGVLFEVAKYTSDERPPLLIDHFFGI